MLFPSLCIPELMMDAAIIRAMLATKVATITDDFILGLLSCRNAYELPKGEGGREARLSVE